MKKLLAGCLVVAVLAGVAVGVALYFGYQAFSPAIDNAAAVLQQARDAAAQSDRLENKTAYVPPADNQLTDAQVRRFLAVHQRTRDNLGPKWQEVQTQATRLEAQAKEDARELTLVEVAAMFRALGSVIVDARRAHIDALNAEQFSASEYSWVRARAYEAAGIEMVDAIDWSAVQEAVKNGANQVGVTPPSLPPPDVPARNRELVKPHMAALQAWLPLTVLGF
jgi:hypothetical protein